ncbi:hypothetical protein ABW19_dt0209036 [Dactylella cylindrospora]|nr:hypothetical protein ABW19_dt0209036 [Dactylella cylindrospora]
MATDNVLSFLLGSDPRELPEWLTLALSGGSRARLCCRYCGSYDHGFRECDIPLLLKPVTSLRADRGGAWRGFGKPSPGSSGYGGGYGGGRGGRGGGGDRGGRGRGGVGGGVGSGTGSWVAGNSDARPHYDGSSKRGGRGYQRGGFSRQVDREEIRKIKDKETARLRLRLKESEGVKSNFPLRRGFNEDGREVYVLANYFSFGIPEGRRKILRYTFHIDPEPKAYVRKELISSYIKSFPTQSQFLVPDYTDYFYVPGHRRPPTEEILQRKIKFESQEYTITAQDKCELDCVDYIEYAQGQKYPKAEAFGSLETENTVIPGHCNDIIHGLNNVLIHGPRLSNTSDLIMLKGNLLFKHATAEAQDSSNEIRVFTIDGLDISSGAQILTGYHASVRPGFDKLLINVNKTTNIFYKPMLITDLIQLRNKANPNQEFTRLQIQALGGYLKGLVVDVDGQPFQMVIRGVRDKNAEQMQMTDKHGKRCLVQEFHRGRGKPLRFSKFPLLDCVPRGPKRPGGNRDVPMELCTIAKRQRWKGQLSQDARRAMIRFACVQPREYIEALEKTCRVMFGLDDSHISLHSDTGALTTAPLSEFGITVNPGLLQVPARVLPKPVVHIASHTGEFSKADIGRDTAWNIDTNPKDRSKSARRLLRCGVLKRYGILEIYENSPKAIHLTKSGGTSEVANMYREGRRAVDEVLRHCESMGISRPGGALPGKVYKASVTISSGNIDTQGIINVFRTEIKRDLERLSDGLILFVLLPSSNPKVYNSIKIGADVIAGVLTVCLNAYEYARKQGSKVAFYKNVALKVNLKLGGVNHTTEGDPNVKAIVGNLENVMLMGADVTHSGSRVLPSICAVVGSYEPSFSRLYTSLSLQTNGELIEAMGQLFKERLAAYKSAHGGKLPTSIVLFRDGVSESQYKQVLATEIAAIDGELKKEVGEVNSLLLSKMAGLGVGEKSPAKTATIPKLTVIVVGKRHHTRFFPTNPDETERNNTEPGLVVDRSVTAVRTSTVICLFRRLVALLKDIG